MKKDFCFQVLLDMLRHSAAVLSVLAKHPVSAGKEFMSIIETFILELLNLTKDSILEVKVATAHFYLLNSPIFRCYNARVMCMDHTEVDI